MSPCFQQRISKIPSAYPARALGLGHAILPSLDSIDGPSLILLGDTIITDQFSSIRNFKPSTASKKLVAAFIETGIPCAGIYSVPKNQVSNYGAVELTNNKISQIVEKPEINEAPSDKVLCGRYVFSAEAKQLLTETYPVTQLVNSRPLNYRNIGWLTWFTCRRFI